MPKRSTEMSDRVTIGGGAAGVSRIHDQEYAENDGGVLVSSSPDRDKPRH